MCGFWNKIFGIGDKEVEVAKSGDNYYIVVKQKGEVIMTVVQPPSSYTGKTGVGGEVSVFNPSGNLIAERTKNIDYGEPIILFNPNNRAGLQLHTALSETKELFPKAQKHSSDIKVDIDKIDEAHSITVERENRVAIGTSAMLQIDHDTSVSVINTPTVTEADREILKLLLHFIIIALVRNEQTYRANIMLLDPRDNLLKIAVHYNMDTHIDKNISLSPDMGCAGTALQSDSESLYDPRSQGLRGIPPDKVWKELKSIISMPIHDSNAARLGVLNIDSNKVTENSGFYDEDFKNAMRLATDIIGKFLEKNI